MGTAHVFSDTGPGADGQTTKDLKSPHGVSQAHKKQSNGIVERAVRRMEEGTSCGIIQSGLCRFWWAYAKRCYCYSRCFNDRTKLGGTSYTNMFGAEIRGATIPFGAAVGYYLISLNDRDKLPQFGSKLLPTIVNVLVLVLVIALVE